MVKNILRSEYKFLLVYFLNTFFLLLIFNLVSEDKYIWYPLLISTVFIVVYMFVIYLKYRNLVNDAKNLKIQNYSPTYSRDLKDNLYLNVISDLHFDYDRKINKLIESNKMNSYIFSQFIHNMKTSVSIIELATHSRNKNASADIIAENRKLKEQLEQSLNILRLEEFSQDYMPNKCDLLAIVKKVINNNKTNFIYNKVFPKVNGNSTYVMTDEKWSNFMINQVVLNAIKYSKEDCDIIFNIICKDDEVVLQIIDEGIGIPSKDLNRVFDLFYTGENGRDNANSTGIGLAMVKNVATFLLVDIDLYSTVGLGTTVEFKFPKG